jgi:pimeloyl-ACP methyl ester carboxylesterase
MTGDAPRPRDAPAQVLAHKSGGAGQDHLVLLHGLGATGEVWSPLSGVVENEPGWRWTSVDLRGHGRSPWAAPYDPVTLAGDVGQLLRAIEPPAERLVVLGHSLGGVVALALASGLFGVRPAAALGLGIKVAWTADELARLTTPAGSAPKVFETREAAIERYLKVSGLWGLAAADDPMATAGVARADGGWRLAMDPRANGVGAPDMPALLGAAHCPVHLARGEHDPLVAAQQLRACDPAAVDLPELGHNAMVEGPRRVWDWVRACLA